MHFYHKFAFSLSVVLCCLLCAVQATATVQGWPDRLQCFDCCAPSKGESLCSVGTSTCTISCQKQCPNGLPPFLCATITYSLIACLSVPPVRFGVACFTVLSCNESGSFGQYDGGNPCHNSDCDITEREWITRCNQGH